MKWFSPCTMNETEHSLIEVVCNEKICRLICRLGLAERFFRFDDDLAVEGVDFHYDTVTVRLLAGMK